MKGMVCLGLLLVAASYGAGSAGMLRADASQESGLRQVAPSKLQHVPPASFPKPAYDSGWIEVERGVARELFHRIGGDPDKYVVDMTFLEEGNIPIHGGINNTHIGTCKTTKGAWEGAHWWALGPESIWVLRRNSDATIDKLRVRIWVHG